MILNKYRIVNRGVYYLPEEAYKDHLFQKTQWNNIGRRKFTEIADAKIFLHEYIDRVNHSPIDVKEENVVYSVEC